MDIKRSQTLIMIIKLQSFVAVTSVREIITMSSS